MINWLLERSTGIVLGVIFAGGLAAVTAQSYGTPKPSSAMKILNCSPHELRNKDSIITQVKCNLNELTEINKNYRKTHPGSVGVFHLRFIIAVDGSVSSAGIDSGTYTDTTLANKVTTAVGKWRFCPIDSSLGEQRVQFRMSFADKKGMVCPVLQPADDSLVTINRRVFESWLGDSVRGVYRHWIAFKESVSGSLDFVCTCDNGRIVSVDPVGGTLAAHPLGTLVVQLKDDLVGKRIRGKKSKCSLSFTVLLLDLRADVKVFDGEMVYRNDYGWYYADPFFNSNPMMHNFTVPVVPSPF